MNLRGNSWVKWFLASARNSRVFKAFSFSSFKLSRILINFIISTYRLMYHFRRRSSGYRFREWTKGMNEELLKYLGTKGTSGILFICNDETIITTLAFIKMKISLSEVANFRKPWNVLRRKAKSDILLTNALLIWYSVRFWIFDRKVSKS